MAKRISIGKDNILIRLLFILFFCSNVFSSVVARTIGNQYIYISYNIVFFSLLILFVFSHGNLSNYIAPFLIYLFVALLFVVTAIVHPEYGEWFNHQTYGIRAAFLNPRCGIWAFIIAWLYKDKINLFSTLKIVCWIEMCFLGLQFYAAMRRGYWIDFDVNTGEMMEQEYNMEFGYTMLFSTSFMGAYAFIKKKKAYYIPFAAGFALILLGGSRGAAIWPVMLFPLMLPFKWKNMNQKQRFIFAFLVILAMMLLVLIYKNFRAVLVIISSILSKIGIAIPSRTIESLLSGTFSDGNGREEIYSMAIDLIKTGGPFGWGVYGDRYVIGRIYKWGYSHNIILELFVSFGYIGGTIACLGLLYGHIKLYRVCNSPIEQIIYITFLATSMKLMLSNSFWYTPSFWYLLAIMMMWKRTTNSRGLIITRGLLQNGVD